MMQRWFALAALAVLIGCSEGDLSFGISDADGDGISDADEGIAEGVNSDADALLDYLDHDSDGDGARDADEAGDAYLATPPSDSDSDGLLDFRDEDSDNDGIADSDELDAEFAIVDSDNDGVPDLRDSDSDGDTISDAVEGLHDNDGDGKPNFRDLDSDGDCIPDALEGNKDSDLDGLPNFLDRDSDGDFLPDSKEDKNCDGKVDPGESSATAADSDGDGTPDLIEVIAGSDPIDPKETIAPGDFYFVLPFQGPGASGTLDFSTGVKRADVFVSMDTTGSFGEEIAAVQKALEQLIVPEIVKIIPDVAFGVGRYEDMPFAPWGLPGDKPYELLQPIATDVKLVVNAINALAPAAGGLDTPESGYEALFQWASGVGIEELGYPSFGDPQKIGGVGFRKDALPIIVQITDAINHQASEYQMLVPSAHGRDLAVLALNAIGARVIGIDSLENKNTPNDPRAQLEELAIATKAVIPPAMDGKCHTGVGGTARDPLDVNGKQLCPVVFDVLPDGSGLGTLIVDAVVQLAQLGVLDISTGLLGKTHGLLGEIVTNGFTTADFIESVTPVPPAPPGAAIQGDVFLGVTPGSTVTFEVKGFNDFQPAKEDDQLFQADIQVLGDLVTLLDVRKVFIIVPRTNPDKPQ